MGPLFNTLIFCCSIGEEIDDNLKNEFGGGHYFIKDPNKFIEHVKRAIHIKFMSKLRNGESNYNPATQRIECIAKPVDYVREKPSVAISRANQIDRSLDLDVLFQKTNNYQHEEEYRFAFFMRDTSDQTVANLQLTDLIIRSKMLKKTLSSSLDIPATNEAIGDNAR